MPRHVEHRLAAVEDRLAEIEEHLGPWPAADEPADDTPQGVAIVPDESGTWRTVIGPDGTERRVNGQAAAERLAAEIEEARQ